jgi:hypothetical protein
LKACSCCTIYWDFFFLLVSIFVVVEAEVAKERNEDSGLLWPLGTTKLGDEKAQRETKVL